MNFRAPLRFLGRLLLVLAVALLLPALCCWLYGEINELYAFLASAALTAASGALLFAVGRDGGELYRREGFLIVVGGWVLASLFGAVPYLLTGTLSSPADALFESASGFTTTGASVLTDIESNDHGILFWRSFTQWLGGMGIIVLFVALLPELGAGARFLYKLEVPGPTAETLHPRVNTTAAVLWKIYLGLSLVLVTLLMFAGMGLYDALTHAFSTLSTGGFSPKNASVAAFNSPLIEVILIVFMVLAGANFSLYYGLRQKHGWRGLWRDPELRLYLLLIFGVSAVIAWHLLHTGRNESPGRAALDSLFQVVAVLTTTGFATADFDQWPALSRFLVVSLMFIGGCAGSTAGGVKIMRFVIGLKAALREVRSMYRPSHVMSVWIGGKAVPDAIVRSVVGFFMLYFAGWALGTLALTFGGHELEIAAAASITTLGNIGPGLQWAGPSGNFAAFADWQKIVMVFLMWVGRLEVYAIAALFTVAFWRR